MQWTWNVDEHEFASNTTVQFSEAPVDEGNIQININIKYNNVHREYNSAYGCVRKWL